MTLILIDLDNTLIDRDAAFRTGVTDFLTLHQLPVDDVDWVMQIDASGYTPRTQVAEAIADRYATHSDNVLDKGRTQDFLARGAREHATITPDTRAALVDARGLGHQVVIVTNGTVPQQTAKIRTAGLDSLVEGWVISEAVGCKKPDPKIFHAAAALATTDLSGA